MKPRSGFQVYRGRPFLDLVLAHSEVFQDLFFGVGFPIARLTVRRPGEGPKGLVPFAVFAPRDECFVAILQVQVRAEERVIGDLPVSILLLLVIPEGVGAFVDGLAQHPEGGPLL
jgi:hypothetical protein